MTFFQDLPIEYQEQIYFGLKNNQHIRKNCQDEGYSLSNIGEYVDDYINRNNTPTDVKRWLENYCL